MSLYGKQRKWKHCTHYLSTFPSYKDYKVPNDILKEGCPWGNWVTFEQKIIAIEYKVGKWSNPIELFKSRDFSAMYDHPVCYRAAALDYLTSIGLTDNQKKICIYAMRNCAWEYDSFLFLKKGLELYKADRLSLDLFHIILSIMFKSQNQVIFYECSKDKTLHQALKEVSAMPKIGKKFKQRIKNILSNILPKEHWDDGLPASNGALPYQAAYHQMQKEYVEYIVKRGAYDIQDLSKSDQYIPEYLIIFDHPGYYLYSCNDHILLQDDCQSSVERYWAILAMRQVGSYSVVVNAACDAYTFLPDWDPTHGMPLKLMENLFYCNFIQRGPFKYPSCILDYQDKELQRALNRFIALPTIPCGLKAVARKVLAGTLATKEEMEEMRNYIAFRKTHFTLYETIPPNAKR